MLMSNFIFISVSISLLLIQWRIYLVINKCIVSGKLKFAFYLLIVSIVVGTLPRGLIELGFYDKTTIGIFFSIIFFIAYGIYVPYKIVKKIGNKRSSATTTINE